MFCPFNILRYKFGVEYLKRSQKRQIQPAQKYFSPFRLIGIFSQLTPDRLFCLVKIVKKFVVKLGEQKGEQPITFENERTGWSEKKTSWSGQLQTTDIPSFLIIVFPNDSPNPQVSYRFKSDLHNAFHFWRFLGTSVNDFLAV